jgi:hypothetical protein
VIDSFCRFLRVEQDALVYYVKADGKERKGDIKIDTITGVAYVVVYKGRTHCFAVHTNVENNRTYYIQGSLTLLRLFSLPSVGW